MAGKKFIFDFQWDVDKYKSNYDPEHWDLCRKFMLIHKTKYPEQKLVHLTEAFYQIGVYGSSYDLKTTRMVSALTVEVLEDFLCSHPGTVQHPFNKSAVLISGANKTEAAPAAVEDSSGSRSCQSGSIWDVAVDQTIIANVLIQSQLQALLKGFVIIYDVRKMSTMNDNKISILEESFKRSKFGPCHWDKDDTHNTICPIKLSFKYKGVVLAEAVGSDEKALRVRLAQAVLSKIAAFSPGIEAKWGYYRDGRMPDLFDRPNQRRTNIYRIMRRSQFKAMAEVTSFIDTFANSDSFAEIVFGMDFNNVERKQIIQYISKSWSTKLTHRIVSKMGVKSKAETHVCVYHNRTGEEMQRWLDQCGGENERYRLIPPGQHRRAGTCDNNVRQILQTNAVKENQPAEHIKDSSTEVTKIEDLLPKEPSKNDQANKESIAKEKVNTKKQDEAEKQARQNKTTTEAVKIDSKTIADNKVESSENELEKLLDGFVLFYDTTKNSLINKDDWFSALCASFKSSKFGPIEVITENVRPLRTKCIFKWKEMVLASAEGLTETQAKTAATLQLISKLEPFTYIIQAKEEYFFNGQVPSFIEKPDASKSDVYRVVQRKHLPSYYSIFQTIDEFVTNVCYGEMVFGEDFSSDLKNEIVVYVQAKGLDYRYFTTKGQEPPTHMAVYHTIIPEKLKEHLLQNGGENDKYKLILPPKAELLASGNSSSEKEVPKVSEKPVSKPTEKPSTPCVEKPVQDSPKNPQDLPKPLPDTAKIPPNSSKPPQNTSKPPPNTSKPSPYSSKPTPETKLLPKPQEAKVAEKRKNEEKDPTAEDTESNKIQIKLKKFRKEEVEYPEDTGGDFPGLIIWLNIKKNSASQKNLFNIVLESFKMSKYGELTVEESDESVWGRKEPLKKCVIKSNRKVLAVGLGESKTEAKHSASLQVMRLLRKHCYAIQAKESYYKEGKATPFDFTPDPKKEDVYRLAKRDQLKDRAAVLKFIDNFSRNVSNQEVIFGDDFTYDERESILVHCRQISLSYRLMKCQSTCKQMHTHIAIYHQRPLPALKAGLMQSGGEDDRYRLIPPGGQITIQDSTSDLWPDTLENGKQDSETNSKTTLANENKELTHPNQADVNIKNGYNSKIESLNLNTINSSHTITIDFKQGDGLDNFTPTYNVISTEKSDKDESTNVGSKGTEINQNAAFNNFSAVSQPHPMTFTSPMGMHTMDMPLYMPQEMVYGPQPQHIIPPPMPTQSYQDLPLAFGPQPMPMIYMPPDMVPQMFYNTDALTNASAPPPTTSQEGDLRDELARKRQTDTLQKDNVERKVYDMSTERKVIRNTEGNHGVDWSRKVFVDGSTSEGQREKPLIAQSREKSQDLREKLSKRDLIDKTNNRMSEEKIMNKLTPGRNEDRRKSTPERNRQKLSAERHQRISPNRRGRRTISQEKRIPAGDRRRNSPMREFSPRRGLRSPGRRISPRRDFRRNSQERRFSPRRDFRQISPERRRYRGSSRERSRPFEIIHEERIVRERGPSYDSRVLRDRREYSSDRDFSRSRSPMIIDTGDDFRRGLSPVGDLHHFRDLWDNIGPIYSESIFMYKYIKQDSTTESNPFALLRATRSMDFNVDFEFIKEQISVDEWQVAVELVTDHSSARPLVGEAVAATEEDARIHAANHAADTIQKACRIIEPNYRYFAEGGTPEFIARRHPMKTSVYEIIQNLDPSKPLDRYTVEVMFRVFMGSDLEDLFFLATDFSYLERLLVIEVAHQAGLWWRLFGPRHPEASPDDVVSTQHVCVCKQRSAMQLLQELLANGGSTNKYTLVDPRETRLTRPRNQRY